MFGLESNLLAHHLDALEAVGIIGRTRSSGDGRRRYVHLVCASLDDLGVGQPVEVGDALFVCTRNSARSQLAAALWRDLGGSARSAGTHPAVSVHPRAVSAATRAGLDLSRAMPRTIDESDATATLLITVCDQAHEELGGGDGWLHWSIPDPVVVDTDDAFDTVLAELRARITATTTVRAD